MKRVIVFLATLSLFAAHDIYVEELNRYLRADEILEPLVQGKRPGHYSKADWAQAIDATWGTGLSTSAKLGLFDVLWQDIHDNYGAFHHTQVKIQELRDRYRPEIAAGVSRGRFAAITSHFMHQLKELHSNANDNGVTWGSALAPGIPIMVIGAWSDVSHFGASLTPMPDGSALVYRVVTNHVLGLQPGDQVLGYDGIPWLDLVDELMEAELPIRRHGGVGSTDEAMEHCLIMAAGENWHLFDTIDIRKHSTGEVVSLPTAPLVNQTGRIYGNEQMPVAGVEMPDWYSNRHVTWGRVTGSNLGYVYVGSWSTSAAVDISNQFHQALLELQDTDGLIVDFRRNLGGYMLMAHYGYSLIFNRTFRAVAFDVRGDDPNDFFLMKPHRQFTPRLFTFHGDTSTHYDQPIAVLSGPGAQSNGDWESIRMRLHEKVRSFGKASNGGFTSSDNPSLGQSGWYYQKATGSGYMMVDHEYLTHQGSPVDEEVWLTPDDVAIGVDTVVNRAIDWINESNLKQSEHTYRIAEIHKGPEQATYLSLVNTHDEEVSLHIEGIAASGMSYGTATLRSLAAREKANYAVSELFPAVLDLIDWVKITSSDSVAVWVELQGEGTRSSYRPSQEVQGTSLVPHVALDQDKFQTTISAVNAGASDSVIMLQDSLNETAWPGFGAPWTQSRIDVGEFWSGTLPSWVELQSSAPNLAAMEWFAYRDGSLGMASLGLGNSPSTRLHFLHIAKDTGLFWTGFVYVNPQDVDAQVTETYYSDDGQIVEVRHQSLAAGEKVVWLSDHSSPLPENASWLDVESSQGLVGYELFGSAEGLTNRYIVGLPTATRGSDQLVFDYVPGSSETWAGYVAVNLGESASTILFELMSREGALIETKSVIDVPAKGKVSFLASDLFANRTGAWVRAHSENGLWAGFLLWGDQGAEREYLSGVEAVLLP